jgi:hypothetical protein
VSAPFAPVEELHTYDELHCTYVPSASASAPLARYARTRERRRDVAPSPWYRNEAERRTYDTVTDSLSARINASDADDELKSLEQDNIAKSYNYWRYHPPGYELFTDPLWRPGHSSWYDEAFADTKELLLWLRAHKGLAHAPKADDVPVRLDAHGGWPTYAPGTALEEKLGMLRASVAERVPYARAVDRLSKECRSLAPLGSVGSRPVITRFTRVQGAKRGRGWPAASNEAADRRLKVWQDLTSAKHRAVFAFGLTPNSYLWGLQAALFALFHGVEQYPDSVDHGFRYMLGLHDRGLQLVDEDISSFDITIPYEQLLGCLDALIWFVTTYRDELISVEPYEVESFASVVEALMTTPVITPAYGLSLGDLMLYARHGTQPSGNQLTTIIGNIINTQRLVRKMALLAYKGDFARALRGVDADEWGYIVQSDDTALAMRPGLVDDWRALALYGYKTTTQGSPIFLQRRFDVRRRIHYGLVARMWNSLINREAMNETFGRAQLQLGMWARVILTRDSPLGTLLIDAYESHPKTFAMWRDAARHDIRWHERAVAASVKQAQPTPGGMNFLLGLYGGEGAAGGILQATPTGQTLSELLLGRRFYRKKEVRRLAEMQPRGRYVQQAQLRLSRGR